ncbi:hypothetical protein [Actinoplanes sp. NPDC051859]|uniref:hypothetical protein n=1 Tax=Actinoplanes sp. NPDC051859 TaxID=3363909 RepID=UPI0037A63C96
MRWLELHLRCRGVPTVAGFGFALVAAVWILWTIFSESRDVDFSFVLLIIVLLVSAASATLTGADDALDRTAAKPWIPVRLAHLLAAYAIITGLLLLTLATPTRFGPAAEVSRDVAGLLGLAALGAAVVGAHRSWFLPLLWTLSAIFSTAFSTHGPGSATTARQSFTWMLQPVDSQPAALVAATLATTGLIAYTLRGTPPRPASDPAPS